MQGFLTAECVAVLMFLVGALPNNSKLQFLTVNSGNFEHWQLCEHLIIVRISDSE